MPLLSPVAPTPAHDDDRDPGALLRLVAAAGPLDSRRELLRRHGTPTAALEAGADAWRASGLTLNQVDALRAAPDAAALRWLDATGHRLIGWHEADYPPLLRDGPNPPLALFVAGDASLLWTPGVAVVGSRAPTPGGRDNAAQFARAFVRAGLAVTSGLAAGIDTAAHEAALAIGGTTVAVLGTGPDVPYPRGNAGLMARIAQEGVVVSEHLPGTGAVRAHFPSRNRILAGLSLGAVVVEAARRSGALITARLAAECGREVFALPGSIHNPMARGCHRLIRDGAALVEAPGEVVEALSNRVVTLAQDLRLRLGTPTPSLQASPASPVRGEPPADRDYQLLWSALGHDPTDMDQLVARTGLTAAAVSSMLLLMELDGRVVSQHGRYFRQR